MLDELVGVTSKVEQKNNPTKTNNRGLDPSGSRAQTYARLVKSATWRTET